MHSTKCGWIGCFSWVRLHSRFSRKRHRIALLAELYIEQLQCVHIEVIPPIELCTNLHSIHYRWELSFRIFVNLPRNGWRHFLDHVFALSLFNVAHYIPLQSPKANYYDNFKARTSYFSRIISVSDRHFRIATSQSLEFNCFNENPRKLELYSHWVEKKRIWGKIGCSPKHLKKVIIEFFTFDFFNFKNRERKGW